ncbi:phage gp6-like head-tail connector protein [Kribbella sp. DT2]|uniref:phage gp6-like head-tail connector protein n=1 Tax=Kribbella sp. DT2 TaxID=3393427 RepID=UPI003CF5D4CA
MWAPDYVTEEDLKAYLRISDSVDDMQIAWAIPAASRAVDQHCNRQFGLVDIPEARTYTASWDRGRGRYVVAIDDLMTVTGLSITGDAAVTDYSLQPSNADVKGKPWTSLILNEGGTRTEDGISITARWGWTDVPLAVQQATLLQASRFFARRDAAFGVAGSPDIGSEMRLLAKVDPDVAVVLSPYQRWWAAV